MPATKPALSFDEMIKNDRKRRAAEQKAQEIFGRKKTNGTSTEKRTSLPGGSLASRVGVNKRSVSSSASRNPDRTGARPPSTLSRSTTAARLETALHKTDVFNTRKPNASRSTRTELNIRGAAGPYTIVAQNFAPGTTAADIESVMQPVGGTMISSRLVASKPTVIAELVFVDKAGADAVIETFNNQKADGRLLYVFLKSGSAPAPEEILAPVPVPLVEETAYYNQNQDDQMVDDSQPIQQAGRLSPPPAETQNNGNVQQGSQNGGYQNGYDRRQGGHGGYGGRGLWQDRRQEQGGYYGQDRRDGWGYGSRRGGWGGPRNGGW